ncbi:IclR family transcriptional regulator [Paraburkholderia susongensis]|uniref:Transcriptional regulator, IclR family n=1 Tax=Paraburkholderia susongensis TaxID=1515439 RepID=A0A1X7LH95_9BURK|nr:IclR family transcriptional regulator [Paraburkholderia susongensis]SMG53236.1 transcriptional regulator, IclR family [Paraburkholderia susongensis]
MNNTLIKGLCLLEVLARRGESMGVSELAVAAGMPKSGVHRLLQALVDERYVEQCNSGRYRVSIKLWEVASAALPGFDLRRHAESVMHALVDETGESVHLSVLDQHDVVYVHKLEAATNPVRAYSQIGGRVPAHCVATGKAMMAFRGPHWLAIAAEHLSPATANTITEPRAFLTEMAQIRAQGYASNCGEWRLGIHGLASPIFDDAGTVVAAIGISGPAERLNGIRRESLIDHVREAGQTLSTMSGTVPPYALLLSVTNHWRSTGQATPSFPARKSHALPELKHASL